MLKYAGVYAAVLVTMVVIDAIWLRVIAVSWYEAGMGSLLAPSPNLFAAGLFYLLFPLGLLIFAVLPDAAGSSILKVATMGALFGFFAYATYDLTNLAVIKDWPVGLTALDMAWGTVLSGVASAAGKLALNYFQRQT
ncbi:MAG: hypothetical protein JWQ72_1280 [Polaromonas sp.]|nr:hypothetical protein [Polaromonas sp.]